VYSYLAVFKVSLCFLNAFKKLKANESIRKAMLVYELVKNKTIPLEKFIDVGWYKGAGDLEFEKQALGHRLGGHLSIRSLRINLMSWCSRRTL
jgi:hypothetical protein